jgi:hypothetical protein
MHLRHVQVSTGVETLRTIPRPQKVSSISLPGPANRLMINVDLEIEAFHQPRVSHQVQAKHFMT